MSPLQKKTGWLATQHIGARRSLQVIRRIGLSSLKPFYLQRAFETRHIFFHPPMEPRFIEVVMGPRGYRALEASVLVHFVALSIAWRLICLAMHHLSTSVGPS